MLLCVSRCEENCLICRGSGPTCTRCKEGYSLISRTCVASASCNNGEQQQGNVQVLWFMQLIDLMLCSALSCQLMRFSVTWSSPTVSVRRSSTASSAAAPVWWMDEDPLSHSEFKKRFQSFTTNLHYVSFVALHVIQQRDTELCTTLPFFSRLLTAGVIFIDLLLMGTSMTCSIWNKFKFSKSKLHYNECALSSNIKYC